MGARRLQRWLGFPTRGTRCGSPWERQTPRLIPPPARGSAWPGDTVPDSGAARGVLDEGAPSPEQRSEEEQGGCTAGTRCWCTVPASCGLKAGAELRFWFLCVPYLIAAGTLLSALVQLWQKVGCQLFWEQGRAALRCQNSTAMPLCASKIRYRRGLLSHSFTGLLFSGSSCCLGEEPVQMGITI